DVWTKLSRPADETLGRPLAVVAVRQRTVRFTCDGAALGSVASPVRGDTLGSVRNLDRRWRCGRLEPLADQFVRNAIEAIVEGNGVVDVDARKRGLRWLEALLGQKLELGLIDALE